MSMINYRLITNFILFFSFNIATYAACSKTLDTTRLDYLTMPLKCASDKEAPSIVCASVSQVAFENSRAELWAKDFCKSASDNCTPTDSLIYTFGKDLPVLDKWHEKHYFKCENVEATIEEYLKGEAYLWHPKYQSSALIFRPKGKRNVVINVFDRSSTCSVPLTEVLIMDSPFLKYLNPKYNMSIDSLIKNGPDGITSEAVNQYLTTIPFYNGYFLKRLWKMGSGWKIYCIKHQFIYLTYDEIYQFLKNELQDKSQIDLLTEKLVIAKYRENLDNSNVKYIVELSQSLAETKLITQKKALVYLLNYDLYVGKEVQYKPSNDFSVVYAKDLINEYPDTYDSDLLDVVFGKLIIAKIDTAYIHQIIPTMELLAESRKLYIYYDILSYCYYRIGQKEKAYEYSAKARSYSKMQAYPGRAVYLNAFRAYID
jgi:hypothetical protein